MLTDSTLKSKVDSLWDPSPPLAVRDRLRQYLNDNH